MITREDFSLIDNEVQESLDEAFNYGKEKSLDHDYILYLADGEYKDYISSSTLHLNPYSIDSREDRYKDQSRLNFFIKFMKLFYAFPKGKDETDDNEYRLTMELMIYCHIWESTPFLRQLFRLASLAAGESYNWRVTVPEMGKHIFIRKNIRDIFKSHHLKLAEVITKGFHTSLRNAFAHSEYGFNEATRLIHLGTYKGEAWDIDRISYNDWTRRFAYSSLLAYHLLNKKVQRRKCLSKESGTNEFLIIHPITENRFRVAKIYYDVKHDGFNFYKA
jgi:hypothetical protein